MSYFLWSGPVDLDAEHLTGMGTLTIAAPGDDFGWSDTTSTTALIFLHDFGGRSEALDASIADGYTMAFRMRAEAG